MTPPGGFAPSTSAGPGSVESPAVPGARLALALLICINLFNYVDRQVLAAVEPDIREHFFPSQLEEAVDKGYDLVVLPPGNDRAGLPKEGRNQIVLATINQVPTFRFFNDHEDVTLDSDATKRPDLAQKLEALRNQAVGTFPSGPFPVTVSTHLILKEPTEAKFWTGLLSTAFLITYMLAAPLFGALANRTSRWLLIGIGVMLWSLASGGSGLATLFVVLILTRCLVGIGEAIYGPVAPDMISDLYPEKKRGQVLAWFYTAIPFGGALGYAIGMEVSSAAGDWRYPFYVVVVPGLLLGVWCFFMREPRRGQSDAVPGGIVGRRKERLVDYLVLLRTPSFVLNTAGMTAMTFAMGGLAFWAAGYLKYRGVRELAGINAVTAFGAMTALCGLAATLLGGLAGDALRSRFSGSYFLVSGGAMVLAFPMLLLVIWVPFPWAWIPLMLFVFFLFFNTGPTNTILANVTHPLLRAPGFALNILVIHALGDAASPPLMGEIAGMFPRNGRSFFGLYDLDAAFLVVSVTVLLGGLLWLWGAHFLERDTRRAPFSLPDEPPLPASAPAPAVGI